MNPERSEGTTQGLRFYNPHMLVDNSLVASFTARHRELNDLLHLVRTQPAAGPLQHVLVCGERGMGKSTLARRALIAVKRDADLSGLWQPVPFAEESYRVTSLGKLWLEALANLSAATGDPAWLERADDLRKGEKDDARMEARARDLLTEYRQGTGKRPILLLENLDEIFSQINDTRALSRLRADLQSHDDFMILATATRLTGHLTDYGKPFYQFFRVMELQGLDPDATMETVHALGERLNCAALSRDNDSITARIQTIRTMTGGNPRLIQLTARLVAELPDGTAMGDLERLVDEQTPYFKARVDFLPAQQREIVQTMAGLWDPVTAGRLAEIVRLSSSQVSAQLKKLEEAGFVSRVETGRKGRVFYEVSARLYSLYFVLRQPSGVKERLEGLVDFLSAVYGPTGQKAMLDAATTKYAYTGNMDHVTATITEKLSEQADVDNVMALIAGFGQNFISQLENNGEKRILVLKEIIDCGQDRYINAGIFSVYAHRILKPEHFHGGILEILAFCVIATIDIKVLCSLAVFALNGLATIAIAENDPVAVYNKMKLLRGRSEIETMFAFIEYESSSETEPMAKEVRSTVQIMHDRLMRIRRGEPLDAVFHQHPNDIHI